MAGRARKSQGHQVQFFINRAGKTLSASRKWELEKAKKLLQAKKEKQKG